MKPRKVDSILDLVGGTPLVRINRMNPNPAVTVYAKLEFQNPGGSVKDRIGHSMIAAAEASGELVAGKIVLEASSGNTAIGLAMACAVKGYKLAVTMSESASEERKKILRAYGAEIILTPGHLATDGAIEEAYRLARAYPDRYVLVDQYNNDANWRAHYEGTGREIWEALDGEVDVVVLTMGTTGTLMGTSRVLHELDPKIRVVGVEPFKGHKIQGLKNMKESYPPGIFQPEAASAIVNVEDEEAYEASRRLAREEGILVGMSAGAAMAVALREAAALEKGTVVALLPDSGERYLSTTLFASKTTQVPVRFYNSLSREVESLVPVREGKVGIYSCGPSLDGPPDVGLCRRLVFADVLARYLRCRDFDVTHVMNIADIDDRTITECLRSGQPLAEFTARWESAHREAMATLRVRQPDHMPRASEYVRDMMDEARSLIDKGLAYEKLRSVYFSISRFAAYGKLSGVDLEKVKLANATEYDYYEKENPRDFALFKRSTLAELKAGIYWSTPWGNARPSWHVECSTMATDFLGQPFDLHTASTDLLFPHGDNEIAIAEGLTGKPFANTWLHSEVVMAEGRKVSRRAGNVLTLADLLDRGWDGAAVRFWLLSTHYRRVLRYSEEELTRAGESVRRLNALATRLRVVDSGEPYPEFGQRLYEARHGWCDMLDNDLNVPRALGHLFKFVRQVNTLANEERLSREQAAQALAFLRDVDGVLAVLEVEAPALSKAEERLLEERNDARAQRDFARADTLRRKLAAAGIEVVDGEAGTTWRRLS